MRQQRNSFRHFESFSDSIPKPFGTEKGMHQDSIKIKCVSTGATLFLASPEENVLSKTEVWVKQSHDYSVAT